MGRNRALMVSRKTMVEEGVYHVTQRAPGRERLFIEESDYLGFLKLLKKTSKEFSIDIFCFALLPNHLHILLKTKEKNLDKAMKFLFQSYAQYFNKKYQRKGHVFCGVYRASLCQDDNYLITASLYIHLNPYKARLTSDVFKYRWFSLEPYIKPIKSSFLKVDLILSLLNNRDENDSRNIYRRLIKQGGFFKYRNLLEDQSAIKKFYDEFLTWVKKNLPTIDLNKTSDFNAYLELEKKIEEIRLKRPLVGPVTKKAIVYIVEQLKARGYSLKESAEKMGVCSRTIYRILKMSQY